MTVAQIENEQINWILNLTSEASVEQMYPEDQKMLKWISDR